jgi:hypothetical protein
VSRKSEVGASDAVKAEEFFSIYDLADMEASLMHTYTTKIPPEAKAWEFLVRSFSAAYVNALDGLVHPPGYAACFVANPTDAAMGGTYGDGHRGVCLKFKTSPDSSGRPALALNTAVGMGGDMKIFYQYVPHTFGRYPILRNIPRSISFARSAVCPHRFDPMKLLGGHNTGGHSNRGRFKRRGNGRMRRNIDLCTRPMVSTLERSPHGNFATGFPIFRGSSSARKPQQSTKRKY